MKAVCLHIVIDPTLAIQHVEEISVQEESERVREEALMDTSCRTDAL